MYVSSIYIQPDTVQVGEIQESWSGKNVQVSGTLSEYGEGGGHLFMELENGGDKVDLVMFDTDKSFSEGDEVTAQGHIDIYEGELQIVAEEIEKN